MTRPNFFLLGAPKSGSTALYTYLSEHPQVFFPRLKEPRYFAADLGAFREITDLESYQKLYAEVPTSAVAIGDGSPWYLCSEEAIGAIRSFAPDAQAVVLLRNPLEMLPSLHNQFLFTFKETEPNLREAWNLQDSRRQGRNLPPASPSANLLQYGKLTLFGDQIERLMSQWPHDQIHVILFDDFRSDTQAVYRKVIQFLGLVDDGRCQFPVINEASRHRHRKAGWMVSSPASPINRMIRQLRNFSGWRSTGVLAPLLRGNRLPQQSATIEEPFRSELVEFYRSDVIKLGQLIERDLSHWLS